MDPNVFCGTTRILLIAGLSSIHSLQYLTRRVAGSDVTIKDVTAGEEVLSDYQPIYAIVLHNLKN
eukprot:scaffold6304_cov44-Attheya_sp.AAC.2